MDRMRSFEVMIYFDSMLVAAILVALAVVHWESTRIYIKTDDTLVRTLALFSLGISFGGIMVGVISLAKLISA